MVVLVANLVVFRHHVPPLTLANQPAAHVVHTCGDETETRGAIRSHTGGLVHVAPLDPTSPESPGLAVPSHSAMSTGACVGGLVLGRWGWMLWVIAGNYNSMVAVAQGCSEVRSPGQRTAARCRLLGTAPRLHSSQLSPLELMRPSGQALQPLRFGSGRVPTCAHEDTCGDRGHQRPKGSRVHPRPSRLTKTTACRGGCETELV